MPLDPYYLRHGFFAGFPTLPGSKEPFGRIPSFAKDYISDPEQIAAHIAAHPDDNWGMVAGPSGCIIVDIDKGDDGLKAWFAFCTKQGMDPTKYPPHVRTQSGGFHIYFRVPADVDARALRQPDAAKGIVNVRAGNGYAICAGSVYEGRTYELFNDIPPHPAPQALVDHCTRKTSSVGSKGFQALGHRHAGEVAAMCTDMYDKGAFDDYHSWIGVGMALKLEYGAPGLEIWEVCTHSDVPLDEIEKHWNSFASEATPGVQTLATWIKKARELGYKDRVGDSVEAMFPANAVAAIMQGEQRNVAPTPPLPPSTPGPAGADGKAGLPMVGATAVLADLGAPILAGFLAAQNGRPAPDAPALPPEMSGHPLYERLNLAISHAVAMAERAPGDFRASAIDDVIGVLALTNKTTMGDVVARIRGAGAVLPEGRIHLATTRFESQVTREVRAGQGWRTNNKGEPDPLDADNMAVFLRLARVETRFNVFARRIELRWTSGEWAKLSEDEINRLRAVASQQEHRYRPHKEYFKDMLADQARQTSFNPVLDRVDACEAKWKANPVPVLDTWLVRACGVEDTPYHRAVGRNIIGGIVRRARHPGCKHDEVAIFISKTGYDKSKLCRILALDDNWFTDSVTFDGSPQNVVPQMFGKLVVELAELDGMARREVQAIKRFLSAQSDYVTLKYQTYASDHARQGIFVGTSNENQPLTDTTGNRRFLPVRVDRPIDIDWLREHVEQIVGEAAHYEARGATFGIPSELWNVAAEHQETARSESNSEIILHDLFANQPDNTFITSGDLVRAMTLSKITPASKGLDPVMNRLGYYRFQGQAPVIGKARGWVKSEHRTFQGCKQLVPSQSYANGGGVKLGPPVTGGMTPPPVTS